MSSSIFSVDCPQTVVQGTSLTLCFKANEDVADDQETKAWLWVCAPVDAFSPDLKALMTRSHSSLVGVDNSGPAAPLHTFFIREFKDDRQLGGDHWATFVSLSSDQSTGIVVICNYLDKDNRPHTLGEYGYVDAPGDIQVDLPIHGVLKKSPFTVGFGTGAFDLSKLRVEKGGAVTGLSANKTFLVSSLQAGSGGLGPNDDFLPDVELGAFATSAAEVPVSSVSEPATTVYLKATCTPENLFVESHLAGAFDDFEGTESAFGPGTQCPGVTVGVVGDSVYKLTATVKSHKGKTVTLNRYCFLSLTGSAAQVGASATPYARIWSSSPRVTPGQPATLHFAAWGLPTPSLDITNDKTSFQSRVLTPSTKISDSAFTFNDDGQSISYDFVKYSDGSYSLYGTVDSDAIDALTTFTLNLPEGQKAATCRVDIVEAPTWQQGTVSLQGRIVSMAAANNYVAYVSSNGKFYISAAISDSTPADVSLPSTPAAIHTTIDAYFENGTAVCYACVGLSFGFGVLARGQKAGQESTVLFLAAFDGSKYTGMESLEIPTDELLESLAVQNYQGYDNPARIVGLDLVARQGVVLCRAQVAIEGQVDATSVWWPGSTWSVDLDATTPSFESEPMLSVAAGCTLLSTDTAFYALARDGAKRKFWRIRVAFPHSAGDRRRLQIPERLPSPPSALTADGVVPFASANLIVLLSTESGVNPYSYRPNDPSQSANEDHGAWSLQSWLPAQAPAGAVFVASQMGSAPRVWMIDGLDRVQTAPMLDSRLDSNWFTQRPLPTWASSLAKRSWYLMNPTPQSFGPVIPNYYLGDPTLPTGAYPLKLADTIAPYSVGHVELLIDEEAAEVSWIYDWQCGDSGSLVFLQWALTGPPSSLSSVSEPMTPNFPVVTLNAQNQFSVSIQTQPGPINFLEALTSAPPSHPPLKYQTPWKSSALIDLAKKITGQDGLLIGTGFQGNSVDHYKYAGVMAIPMQEANSFWDGFKLEIDLADVAFSKTLSEGAEPTYTDVGLAFQADDSDAPVLLTTGTNTITSKAARVNFELVLNSAEHGGMNPFLGWYALISKMTLQLTNSEKWQSSDFLEKNLPKTRTDLKPRGAVEHLAVYGGTLAYSAPPFGLFVQNGGQSSQPTEVAYQSVTFPELGISASALGSSGPFLSQAVAQVSQGFLVLVTPADSSYRGFALALVKADGSLDESFEILTTPMSYLTSLDNYNSICPESDRYEVAGYDLVACGDLVLIRTRICKKSKATGSVLDSVDWWPGSTFRVDLKAKKPELLEEPYLATAAGSWLLATSSAFYALDARGDQIFRRFVPEAAKKRGQSRALSLPQAAASVPEDVTWVSSGFCVPFATENLVAIAVCSGSNFVLVYNPATDAWSMQPRHTPASLPATAISTWQGGKTPRLWFYGDNDLQTVQVDDAKIDPTWTAGAPLADLSSPFEARTFWVKNRLAGTDLALLAPWSTSGHPSVKNLAPLSIPATIAAGTAAQVELLVDTSSVQADFRSLWQLTLGEHPVLYCEVSQSFAKGQAQAPQTSSLTPGDALELSAANHFAATVDHKAVSTELGQDPCTEDASYANVIADGALVVGGAYPNDHAASLKINAAAEAQFQLFIWFKQAVTEITRLKLQYQRPNMKTLEVDSSLIWLSSFCASAPLPTPAGESFLDLSTDDDYKTVFEIQRMLIVQKADGKAWNVVELQDAAPQVLDQAPD